MFGCVGGEHVSGDAPFLIEAISGDSAARSELETARAWGVTPSVFAGRPVAEGEPLWLETDRALALALAAIEADACPGCGQPRTESMQPHAAYAYKAAALRCHGCAAIRTETARIDDPAGIYMHVKRKKREADRGNTHRLR